MPGIQEIEKEKAEIQNEIQKQQNIVDEICSISALSATIPAPMGYIESLADEITAFDNKLVAIHSDGTISMSLINASTNIERVQRDNDIEDSNTKSTETILNELIEKSFKVKQALTALAAAKNKMESLG